MLAVAFNAPGVGWHGKAGLTLTDCSLLHCYSGGKLAPSVKYTLKQASENKIWSSGDVSDCVPEITESLIDAKSCYKQDKLMKF